VPRRLLVSIFTAMLMSCGEAFAVEVEEELRGKVKDSSGTAVSGARLTLLTAQRAVVATATTDQSGAFLVAAVPEGQYVLSVEHPAFAAKRVQVDLTAGS